MEKEELIKKLEKKKEKLEESLEEIGCIIDAVNEQKKLN